MLRWSNSWLQQISDLVGPPEEVTPLGGRAWRVRTSDRMVVVKSGPAAADEAAGLLALASVEGGPPVPGVIHRDAELLVIDWIPPGPASPAHEQSLGHHLAVLHSARWSAWGGGSSWIGACQVEATTAADAASFYRSRLTALARRCGLERPVAAVTGRLESLIPPSSPSLVHGDLWWGNVIWAASGRTYLIDPSTHGGHPEEDLAMLALFGPVPERVYRAYAEVRDLDDGWRERTDLWQLYPLLVHSVVFGGSYVSQAEAVAHRYA